MWATTLGPSPERALLAGRTNSHKAKRGGAAEGLNWHLKVKGVRCPCSWRPRLIDKTAAPPDSLESPPKTQMGVSHKCQLKAGWGQMLIRPQSTQTSSRPWVLATQLSTRPVMSCVLRAPLQDPLPAISVLTSVCPSVPLAWDSPASNNRPA